MAWNKTPQELAESLRKYIEQDERNIETVLHRIGMEAVNWARENGSYKDRTGNLRNSIGYIITKDGQEITSYGAEPAQQNKDIVFTLARSAIPKKGYCLIVFAGMEYGIYVEAKGYTVLTGAVENSLTLKALAEALKRVKGA